MVCKEKEKEAKKKTTGKEVTLYDTFRLLALLVLFPCMA
jgi:hypothetical protein